MTAESASGSGWVKAGSLAELFAGGDCTRVEIEGRVLGLFRIGDQVFALDDICSHGHAHLSEGALEDFTIECPLHGGLFDVRSGRALCAPVTRDVACHEVRITDMHVLVRLRN
jgi:naphthalene 1,2-dioxygenase system ferredoxin subunit